MNQPSQPLYFNGINGESGGYSLPPMSGEELYEVITGEAPPENLRELQYRYQMSTQTHLGVKEGIDPRRVDQAGWGVIFAHDADPAVKEALSPLIALRKEQAGAHFRIYEGADGYRVGRDSKIDFLARNGVGPGPADPEKVPYYLLIVGSPEVIPFSFQYQLDVQYAVGRIYFESLDEYANYARSVVAAETGQVSLPSRATFFGVANTDDPATQGSARSLVAPLYQQLADANKQWAFDLIPPAEATKSRLSDLLNGSEAPALLFTASHGMDFPLGSSRQLPHQGALLCQDWPGPQNWNQSISQDFYFAGDDLNNQANLLGSISFFFACYGAGMPIYDQFSRQAFRKRQEIAPQPFLANLPTRMLANPGGGALAVVGHVDRAWSYSFDWPGSGAQTTVFESTLQRLLTGHPIGSAIEYFNERYAELSSDLSRELEDIEFGKKVDPYALAGMWTANNDARGYAILGDPAVRLPVSPAVQALIRPVIHVQDPVGQTAQSSASVMTEAILAAELVSQSDTSPLSPTAVTEFATPSDPRAQAPFQVANLAEELTNLTISTYGSGQIGSPPEENLKFRTRIALDGDVQLSLPQELEPGDRELLVAHQETVKAALEARLAFIKLITGGE